MKNKKNILFVAYGGGHAPMILPIVKYLEGHPDYDITVLALTMAGPFFAKHGVPFVSFKDFIQDGDDKALEWGEYFAKLMHNTDSGIAYEESVAYLGLSFMDVVDEYGEEEALVKLKDKGRHAFVPLTVLRRVFDRVKPDISITTTSPKAERAANLVARERGVPSLLLEDLFGFNHFYDIDSDYVTTLCQLNIDNLKKHGAKAKRYFITGNPAFDASLRYRGEINYSWRSDNLPGITHTDKVLLWADQPAFWDLQNNRSWARSDEEVIRDLECLANTAEDNNYWMLIRPHPTQASGLYEDWIERKKYKKIMLARSFDLHSLISACDLVISLSSTVMLEAVYMERRVLQFQYHEGPTDMPIRELGVGWKASSHEELGVMVTDALINESHWQENKQKIQELFPDEAATPKVVAVIEDILSGRV